MQSADQPQASLTTYREIYTYLNTFTTILHKTIKADFDRDGLAEDFRDVCRLCRYRHGAVPLAWVTGPRQQAVIPRWVYETTTAERDWFSSVLIPQRQEHTPRQIETESSLMVLKEMVAEATSNVSQEHVTSMEHLALAEDFIALKAKVDRICRCYLRGLLGDAKVDNDA